MIKLLRVFVVLVLLGNVSIEAALVSHWTFDDNAANTTVADSAGSNTGTLTNAGNTSAVSTSGKIGNAFQMDGANDVVNISDDASLRPSNFTVSLWFNADVISGTDHLLVKRGPSLVSYGLWTHSSSVLYFEANDATVNGLLGTTTLNTGQWYHALATYDGSSQELYLDGGSEGSRAETGTVSYATNNLQLSDGPFNTPFDGGIDDVAIWNEALTADEVRSFYDVGNDSSLVYNAGNFDSLKQVHDAGTGSTTINGRSWTYQTGLTQSAGLSQSGAVQTLVFNDSANTGLQSTLEFFWDLDGITAGSGDGTPDGTWDLSGDWDTESDGTGADTNWIDGAIAHFSAGTDATGSYTVTVSGTRTVGGLYFEDGNTTISGGTALDFESAGTIVDVASGLNATIATTIQGSGGWTKTGDGQLNLTGTISNTGDININAGSVDRTGDWVVANASGSNQNLTVQSGADFDIDGVLYVAESGTAAMTITGTGSTVIVGDDSTDNVYIGNSSGANGLLTISNGAVMTATHNAFVLGNASGSVASAVITGAGTTANIKGLYIGVDSAADNNVLVSDSAVLHTRGVIYIGQNANSNGSMTVNNGADLIGGNVTSVGLSGTGSLMLTGSGTSLTNTFGFRAGLNASGEGLITIADDADAVVNGGLSIIGDAGEGDLVVTGSGTTLIGKTFTFGDDANSNGSLSILAGADVTFGTLNVGNNGVGDMTVDGAGTRYTGTSTLTVGSGSGTGTLVLSNGATIDAPTVTLQNNGSTFTADTITLGDDANEIDTLNINTGATATATTIDIQSGGTLNLNRSNGITGSSSMNLSGGTFNTSGNDQSAGGMGTLTMSATSTIDMGAGAILNWASLDETNWTGTLIIHNWSSGKHNASGSDQLVFAEHAGFLHGTHGLQVIFYSDAGSNLVGSSGYFIGNSLVAAPEPGTWNGIGFLLAFGIWFEIRRRRKSRRGAEAQSS